MAASLRAVQDSNFDTQLKNIDPDEFNSDHILFHFVSFASFWRRVANYRRLNQIDEDEAWKLLGPLFALYWRELFEPAMRGSLPGSEHHLLWEDLRTLEWLRREKKAQRRLFLIPDAIVRHVVKGFSIVAGLGSGRPSDSSGRTVERVSGANGG
jgi:hypothetical protein